MSKLLKVEIKLDTSDTPRLTSYFGYWATETLPGFVSTHTDDITPQTSSRSMTVEDGGPRSRTSLGRCDQRWELFRSNIISYLICLHTCASKYVSLLQAGRRLRGGEFTPALFQLTPKHFTRCLLFFPSDIITDELRVCTGRWRLRGAVVVVGCLAAVVVGVPS